MRTQFVKIIAAAGQKRLGTKLNIMTVPVENAIKAGSSRRSTLKPSFLTIRSTDPTVISQDRIVSKIAPYAISRENEFVRIVKRVWNILVG